MKRNSTWFAIAALAASSLTACSEMAGTQSDGIDAIAGASELQCNNDRRTLQSMIDNFEILEGRLPVSEAEMVPKYRQVDSPLVDVDGTGQAVFTPTGGCG